MLKKRKRSIMNFVVMFAFLFASMMFTIAAFSGTSEARFTSSNTTDSIIIDTGNLDIVVTDNYGNPLGPISFDALDPSVMFESSEYYIRITNNGSIPCKIRVGIANPSGDTELQSKVVARGYTSIEDSKITTGFNYITYSPKLFTNSYIDPGETTETYIKFYVLPTSNEDFNVSFDISIKAIQADDFEGYSSARFASTSLSDEEFMNNFITPNLVVPQVTTGPAITVTDAVYGNNPVETVTGSAITVDTIPSTVEQPETVVEETTPTVEETTVPETIVDVEDTVPSTVEETEIVVEETTPTVEETTVPETIVDVEDTVPSTVEETETVVEETTPTVEETTVPETTVDSVDTVPSTVEQTETVVEETIPTVEETTVPETTVDSVDTVPSTVEETETVVEETIPTVEETTVPETIVDVEDTVPSTVEETEIVVEETTPTVEETIILETTVNVTKTLPSVIEPVTNSTSDTNLNQPTIVSEDKQVVQTVRPDILEISQEIVDKLPDSIVTEISTDPAINVDKSQEVQNTDLEIKRIILPDLVVQTQDTEIINDENVTDKEPDITILRQKVLPEVTESDSSVTNYGDVGTNITESTQISITYDLSNKAPSINYTSSENVVKQDDSKIYIVDTKVPINPEQIIENKSINGVSLESVTNNIVFSNTSASTNVPINPEQIIEPISTISTNLNKAIDQDIGTNTIENTEVPVNPEQITGTDIIDNTKIPIPIKLVNKLGTTINIEMDSGESNTVTNAVYNTDYNIFKP